MELIQYKGPFASGRRITIPAQTGYTYVHIGIQVPKTQPITIPQTRLTNNNKTTIKTGEYRSMRSDARILINGETYQLNAADVLEFDGLSEIDWEIQFLDNFPAETIIDIVRRT